MVSLSWGTSRVGASIATPVGPLSAVSNSSTEHTAPAEFPHATYLRALSSVSVIYSIGFPSTEGLEFPSFHTQVTVGFYAGGILPRNSPDLLGELISSDRILARGMIEWGGWGQAQQSVNIGGFQQGVNVLYGHFSAETVARGTIRVSGNDEFPNLGVDLQHFNNGETDLTTDIWRGFEFGWSVSTLFSGSLVG